MPDKMNSIYKYTVNYSALAVELISDSKQLLEINFLNKRKSENSETISETIKKAVSYLDDYFNGKKNKIKIIFNSGITTLNTDSNSDMLYLDMSGYTEKEISVYRELLKVKPGEKISYNELALRSGIPRGARFAGNCMAGNRFPVIIPCHRIIKSDGSIGNYTGGVKIKEFLLKYEASSPLSHH